MKLEPKEPFLDYDCYMNLHRKMNRMQVCMINRTTKNRRTVLYAKYLICIKEGRILSPNEEVDHIDNDKTNDTLENLQIISGRENRKKQATGRTMITLSCDGCGKLFNRERRQVIYKPSGHKKFCSKDCRSNLYRALAQR